MSREAEDIAPSRRGCPACSPSVGSLGDGLRLPGVTMSDVLSVRGMPTCNGKVAVGSAGLPGSLAGQALPPIGTSVPTQAQ